jgi:hypothetical protein
LCAKYFSTCPGESIEPDRHRTNIWEGIQAFLKQTGSEKKIPEWPQLIMLDFFSTQDAVEPWKW